MGGVGSGGSNKKPSRWHKLAGSYRENRHGYAVPLGIDQDKVQVNPPNWLSKHAKAFWRRHRDQCIALNTLDALSVTLFETTCEAYARVRTLDEVLAAEGETVSTKSASKPHPLLSARNSANRQLLQGLNELGLTPAGRKRLRLEWPVNEEPEEDPLAKWESRRNDRMLELLDSEPDPREVLSEQARKDPRLRHSEDEVDAYLRSLNKD